MRKTFVFVIILFYSYNEKIVDVRDFFDSSCSKKAEEAETDM